MSRSLVLTPIVLLVFAALCPGQQTPFDQSSSVPPAPAPDAASPAVPWDQHNDSYRYQDARELVQRNAARKAEQRRQRIAARKWMGYDPLRPPASSLPFMGSSVRWVPVGPAFMFPGRFNQPPRGPAVILGERPGEPSLR